MKGQGIVKRVVDMVTGIADKGVDTHENNIFAPTAALNLFKHINKYVPNHSMILADFDSFIVPRGSIKGIAAPMVTHKLRDPTKWSTYSSYLVPRGHADICFPTDFHFLQHAYTQISNQNSVIYKNNDFV